MKDIIAFFYTFFPLYDAENARVFDTFSSTLMSLSQYWLYFFVKFKIIYSTLRIVVL